MLEHGNDNSIGENGLNQFLSIIIPYLLNDIQILLVFSEVNKHANTKIKDHIKKCFKTPEASLSIIQQLQSDSVKQHRYLNYYREAINPEFKAILTKKEFENLSDKGKMLYILSTNDISNLEHLECKAFNQANHKEINRGLIKNINVTLAISKQISRKHLENIKQYFIYDKRDFSFCLNLQRANLRCVNLSETKLQHAFLRRANLQGAVLESTYLWYANLEYANLQDTNFQGTLLTDSNLQGTNLQNAYLQKTNLQGADLQGANLQSADLQGANFTDAKLSGCCIRLARGLDSLFATAPETELTELIFFAEEDFNDTDSLKKVLNKYKKNSAAIWGKDTENGMKSTMYQALANSLIQQVKQYNSEECIALFEAALAHPFFNQQENSAGFFNNNEVNHMIDSQNIIKEAIEELKEDCQSLVFPCNRASMRECSNI